MEGCDCCNPFTASAAARRPAAWLSREHVDLARLRPASECGYPTLGAFSSTSVPPTRAAVRLTLLAGAWLVLVDPIRRPQLLPLTRTNRIRLGRRRATGHVGSAAWQTLPECGDKPVHAAAEGRHLAAPRGCPTR